MSGAKDCSAATTDKKDALGTSVGEDGTNTVIRPGETLMSDF